MHVPWNTIYWYSMAWKNPALKKEISLDAQLMSNISLKPEDYSLYVEVETLEKLEYIEIMLAEH